MKRPFPGGRWRVGKGGLYYPVVPHTHLRLRVYRGGHVELAP